MVIKVSIQTKRLNFIVVQIYRLQTHTLQVTFTTNVFTQIFIAKWK